LLESPKEETLSDSITLLSPIIIEPLDSTLLLVPLTILLSPSIKLFFPKTLL
jgi:hypothetical protein